MDYISREALKERLEHKYILSDLEHPNPRLYRHTDIMDVIDTIPSADVEEVIRCKDCKYFLAPWGCEFLGDGCRVNKNGYCFFAERRG